MRHYLTIILAILACCHVCNGLRILGLFPLNGKSHWVMGERLMLGLAERGHQLDVVNAFPQKKPVPNYTDISIENMLDTVVNNVTASALEQERMQNVGYVLHRLSTNVCNLLGHEKIQALLKNPPKDPPYDLVIVELFIIPCYLGFGRHLNVPTIGVMTSSFHDWISDLTGNPHNPSFMPTIFSPFSQRMTFLERLMNTWFSTFSGIQLRYYFSMQDEYLKKYFNIDVSVLDLHRELALILVNSHHSYNGVKPMTTGVIEVGGLHITEKADPLSPEVQKWLDESTHGCIYFSFGSMVRFETYPESLQRSFYKAFESIAPVRVLMKIAQKKDLLPGLPKNVMTQSWFPQVSVFKHKNIKAFITHGGLMGTQEAVYFGIPMIGIPLYGDQPTNLNNLANKKIAISLGSIDNVTEDTLTFALNTILKDNTYRDNMKRISQLFKDRPMSAVDTAIYWVEYVARHGNVLQSPAIHLAWWQLHLLDVYGFTLACLAVLLYVVIFVLRKLKNLLFGSKFYKSLSKKDDKSSESKKKK